MTDHLTSWTPNLTNMDNASSSSGFVECVYNKCNVLFDPESNGYDARTLRRLKRDNSKLFCADHKHINDKSEA